MVANVSYTITHPDTLRLAAAFDALVNACQSILIRPWTFGPFAALLGACALVATFRMRRDVALAGVTIVPLAATVAGFSLWQRAFEFYWFMTLMPSAALTIGLALTAWKPAAPAMAAALLVLVLAAQPGRFAHAQTINRLPTYGALVRGSQDIRRRAAEIRSIDIEFRVEPSTNTHFVYERVLGGRITPSAPFAATIEPTGCVRFTPAPAGADEGSHWYYASKACALRRCLEKDPERILDVGAGSGFFSKMLLQRTAARSAVCVDPGYATD